MPLTKWNGSSISATNQGERQSVSGLNSFVYNKLDQVVLSQTPNQAATTEWLFTKYDALGRVVMTGIYNNSSPRNHIQTTLNTETDLWERRTNGTGNVMGYSTVAFPQNMNEVLTVNYYDDYDFDIQAQTYDNALNIPKTLRTHGLLTGTMTEILDGSQSYLLTVNYYDEKERLIQERKQQLSNTWDILSHQYDFKGNLVKTKRVFDNGNSSELLTVMTRFTYDHSGRRMNSFVQVNNEPEVLMSSHIYNDAGQLIEKNLHYNPQTSEYIQSVDYRYNIRGWLKKINNASCSYDGVDNFEDNDAFGEEIFYNDVTGLNTALTSTPSAQYNGNISGIKWKTKAPADDPLDISQKMYVYKYDDLNRMTAGYFAMGADIVNSFDQSLNWFDEKLTYDMMGNILKLKRNAGDFSSQTFDAIDDLTYDYTGTGNKINYIDDAVTQASLTGFTDQNTSGADYTYDSNGNVTQDLNKQTTTIYNFMNLPVDINSGAIKYTYDATGKKLVQAVNGVPTLYADGLEYKNGNFIFNNLERIMTEEGRVRPVFDINTGVPTFYYDYFLKDHLGSVRAVLASEAAKWNYYATMETDKAEVEEQLFYNIPNTRGDLMPGYPPDGSYSPNYKASALNAAQGRPIGHAKVLRVMRGDSLNVNTKYYFEDMLTSPAGSRPAADILSQLSSVFFLSPSNGVSIAGADQSMRQQWGGSTFTGNSDVNTFLGNAMNSAASRNPYTPQAFLVYLFYKDNFQFVPSMSGIQQAAEQNQLGDLAVLDLVVPDNGYFYVYVTNESPVDVDFDNLMIHHSACTLLELNDYYPYGLLNPWLSTAPDPAMQNNYKFQSKELLMDVNPNTQDFGARGYDPVIGRWATIDPLAEMEGKWSPYNFVENNPIGNIDPDGMLQYDWKTQTYRDDDGNEVSYEDAMAQIKQMGTIVYQAGNNDNGKEEPWGSKSGAAVHQKANANAVNRSGPAKNPEQRRKNELIIDALNAGTEFADQDQFQTGEYSYRHAMRNRFQTPLDAMKLADEFVREQFAKARILLKSGKIHEAYYQFSIGLHVMQDATSPVHSGFQEWTGTESMLEQYNHAKHELVYPGLDSNLQIITNKYLDWFQSNNPLPDGNLFINIQSDK